MSRRKIVHVMEWAELRGLTPELAKQVQVSAQGVEGAHAAGRGQGGGDRGSAGLGWEGKLRGIKASILDDDSLTILYDESLSKRASPSTRHLCHLHLRLPLNALLVPPARRTTTPTATPASRRTRWTWRCWTSCPAS